MVMSQRAAICRQSRGHGATVLELQLKQSNKYCSYEHIVSKKAVDKGLLYANIKRVSGFVLKFGYNLGFSVRQSLKQTGKSWQRNVAMPSNVT